MYTARMDSMMVVKSKVSRFVPKAALTLEIRLASVCSGVKHPVSFSTNPGWDA